MVQLVRVSFVIAKQTLREDDVSVKEMSVIPIHVKIVENVFSEQLTQVCIFVCLLNVDITYIHIYNISMIQILVIDKLFIVAKMSNFQCECKSGFHGRLCEKGKGDEGKRYRKR